MHVVRDRLADDDGRVLEVPPLVTLDIWPSVEHPTILSLSGPGIPGIIRWEEETSPQTIDQWVAEQRKAGLILEPATPGPTNRFYPLVVDGEPAPGVPRWERGVNAEPLREWLENRREEIVAATEKFLRENVHPGIELGAAESARTLAVSKI